ncbi:MAG TPA: hypothetical protein EYP47_02700, partial [Methanococcaceae archaeon]|nr:hypothetical protein [Methanococcaceae archaeon]
MIVVPGVNSQELAYRVSKLANCKLLRTEFKRFPDGELYIRVLDNGAIENEDVVFIQSQRDQNDAVVESMLIRLVRVDLYKLSTTYSFNHFYNFVCSISSTIQKSNITPYKQKLKNIN